MIPSVKSSGKEEHDQMGNLTAEIESIKKKSKENARNKKINIKIWWT